jgi:hypothetical protein
MVPLNAKVQAYPWVNIEIWGASGVVGVIVVVVVIIVNLRFVTCATMAMPNLDPLIPTFLFGAVPAVNLQDQIIGDHRRC